MAHGSFVTRDLGSRAVSTFTLKLDVPEIHVHLHVHQHGDSHVLQSIAELRSLLVTTKEEFVGQINDLKTQLDAAAATNAKAQAEITTAVAANTANVAALNQQIADLQAVIAAGGSDVPPEVSESFASLKASADAVTASSKALDDLNPDA